MKPIRPAPIMQASSRASLVEEIARWIVVSLSRKSSEVERAAKAGDWDRLINIAQSDLPHLENAIGAIEDKGTGAWQSFHHAVKRKTREMAKSW